MTTHNVFITGATGYLGRALVPELVKRGHLVRALSRPASARRVPPGAQVVSGNALDAATFADLVAPSDTFIHLIGTPHPSPAKAQQFRDIDLVSVQAAVTAARHAWVRHFIYLSVAYPAPIMQAYIDVRREGEALIRSTGMPATFVRPLYVLGPGHWWPYPLVPVFALLRALPATRESAARLSPVTLRQVIRVLADAVEHPPADGIREVNAPDMMR
jgi:uncharacterized protein YbjT (DUF2867 family)